MHLSLYIPTYHSAGEGWGFVWDWVGNLPGGTPRLKINASILKILLLWAIYSIVVMLV